MLDGLQTCFIAKKIHIYGLIQKDIVLDAIGKLPDDASIEEIADRVEFLAAIQKGIHQLDQGQGIPHEEIKKQLASWLAS